jgi:hypothetical protein
MDNKYLMYGGGALLVLVLLMSRKQGATVINRSDPNAADESRALSEYASRGLESIASVARAGISGDTSKYIAGAQRDAESSRDSAMAYIGMQNAHAAIVSAQAAADAAGKGKTGFNIGIPGKVDFGIHW